MLIGEEGRWETLFDPNGNLRFGKNEVIVGAEPVYELVLTKTWKFGTSTVSKLKDDRGLVVLTTKRILILSLTEDQMPPNISPSSLPTPLPEDPVRETSYAKFIGDDFESLAFVTLPLMEVIAAELQPLTEGILPAWKLYISSGRRRFLVRVRVLDDKGIHSHLKPIQVQNQREVRSNLSKLKRRAQDAWKTLAEMMRQLNIGWQEIPSDDIEIVDQDEK